MILFPFFSEIAVELGLLCVPGKSTKATTQAKHAVEVDQLRQFNRLYPTLTARVLRAETSTSTQSKAALQGSGASVPLAKLA